ncbi:MAG: hypothetical protein QM667_13715 [Asticcacaulis sp.]
MRHLTHTLSLTALCALLTACASVSDPPLPPASEAAYEINPVEAAALKAYPALATRNGAELTLYDRGRVIGQRKSNPQDCGGFATCEVWTFKGPIRLQARPTATLTDFALLAFEHGEGGQEVVIDKAGKNIPLFGYNASAAPDGRFIATGSEEMDELNGTSALVIRDWLNREATVAFEPSCLPLKWADATHLSVTCTHYPYNEQTGQFFTWRFDATAGRLGSGRWRLTGSRWITHAQDPEPDNRPLPTFESVRLRD